MTHNIIDEEPGVYKRRRKGPEFTYKVRGFKGTVSVISSDPPCKDDNARIITVPLKALSHQVLFPLGLL